MTPSPADAMIRGDRSFDADSDATALRGAIEVAYLADEAGCVMDLLAIADPGTEARARIGERATRLVEEIRERGPSGGLDAFLQEYRLSDQEGVVLMCLAEALLRIPDADTADRLIRDKIGSADWESHLGRSGSVFVNASTLALILTGRVIGVDEGTRGDLAKYLHRLVARSGEPVIRAALTQAMRILGHQFVMGRSIEEALVRAREDKNRRYRYSYDMLGEAALSAADAERYFEAYARAIAAVGAESGGRGVIEGPGISVKLSALHPRHEFAQRHRVRAELAPRLLELARLAKAADIGLCVDAEEADRLEPSLDVIEAVLGDPALAGWEGFGLALQAYQKRAPFVIDWLADLARRHRRRIMLRLVKGAYWDSEIKHAQQNGLDGYPVFTRKASTDVSYLACARKILDAPDAFYPQFATHNAHTIAAVLEFAGPGRDFEFQRLYGMGEALYEALPADADLACRVYAPVGGHEELLAYLVRRLLENGANTSFVNRIGDATAPVGSVVADPIAKAEAFGGRPHPRIPVPRDLYGPDRPNAKGLNLDDPATVRDLMKAMEKTSEGWRAVPVIGGEAGEGPGERALRFPADQRLVAGHVSDATEEDIEQALTIASAAASAWDETAAEDRASCLDRMADRLEDNLPELMALCVREGGKTLPDALGEVREAVDFCRYYAQRARLEFAAPEVLPGPTGESNQIGLHGRGVFVCISPWNFPLAIFLGQIAAALAAGNAVIAKPAEQTPLIAAEAVRLLLASGVPPEVLHLLPGDGPAVGAPLIEDHRVSGVAFTGSVEVARAINQALAARDGPIIPLIAETGGQNAMIVDSSALPEQVVADTVISAFRSAGQRCSALRVLFLQEEIADRVIDMLSGAVAELAVGDPGLISTDVGPVIDADALDRLKAHAARMEREGRRLCQAYLPESCAHGTFFAPRAYEIDRLDRLEGEVFGPVLHVIRYAADRLDEVLEAVSRTGYGLTLGIHSRIEGTARHIHQRLRVGNTYVNRNMIGAVVGVQPFGGEGLSGTGPKAGGPRYLYRFATERTLSIDTAATGGNATLLSLDDEAEGTDA